MLHILILEPYSDYAELEQLAIGRCPFLQDFGVTVEVVTDSITAWLRLCTTPYDLLIQNVRRRRVDGVAFYRRLKRDFARPSMPVLTLSADPALVSGMEVYPGDAHRQKIADVDELGQLVKDLLQISLRDAGVLASGAHRSRDPSELVHHTNSTLRTLGLRRIFARGAEASETPVMDGFSSREADERRCAAWGAGRLLIQRAQAPLEEAVRMDPDPLVRATSIWALGQIRRSTGAGWLIRGLEDSSSLVRCAALTVQVGQWSRQAVSALGRLLTDADPMVRIQAARRAAELGHRESLAAVDDALRQEQDEAGRIEFGLAHEALRDSIISAGVPMPRTPLPGDIIQDARTRIRLRDQIDNVSMGLAELADAVVSARDGSAKLQSSLAFVRNVLKRPQLNELTESLHHAFWVDCQQVSSFAALKAGVDLILVSKEASPYARRIAEELAYDLEDIRRAVEAPPARRLPGCSRAMRELRKQVEAAAARPFSHVLLWGGIGTGKSEVAKTIHEHGGLSSGPFEVVDCAALEPNEMEPESLPDRAAEGGVMPRALQRAQGGTLFLKHIDKMPAGAQAALLHALRQSTSVRVISSTRESLSAACFYQELDEDLVRQLSSIRIRVPELQERLDDLPMVVDFLLFKIANRLDRPTPTIDDDALQFLGESAWDGNLYELEGMLEGACLKSNGRISAQHLAGYRSSTGTWAPPPPDRPPIRAPGYAFLRRVDGGAYGEVWLVRNEISERISALKVLYARMEERTKEELNGIYHYAKVSSKCAGLAEIWHVDRSDGRAYYVMEAADDIGGGRPTHVSNYVPFTLTRSLKDLRSPGHLRRSLGIMASLAGSVAYLHRHRLVHRDIKPDNVIFVDGQPQLADPGLVDSFAVSTARGHGARGIPKAPATPPYGAPEGPGLPSADVYSLGKLLYACLAGRPPPDVVDSVPDSILSSQPKTVVHGLERILRQTCAESPVLRRMSADDMVTALDEVRALLDAPGPPSDPQPPPPVTEKPCIRDYSILERLGDGACGVVWRARNTVTNQWVAIKVLFPSQGRTEADADSRQMEIEGWRRLLDIYETHRDGLLPLLHMGNTENGKVFCVMPLADDCARGRNFDSAEYVPRTLAREISNRGRIPEAECRAIGNQLAMVLGHLHDHGYVHRDVKPANIVFYHDRPCLTDAGLLARFGPQSRVGTPGYAPPEGHGTKSGDIYSLGKVIYTMLTGLDAQTSLTPLTDFPSSWKPLLRVAERACAPNPVDRFVNMADMAEALAKV